MMNFSIHGGAMPIGLMLYNSDVNGAIEMELEGYLSNQSLFTKRPVMLFMNGAEGDVGANADRFVENADLIAKKFILSAASALETRNLLPVNDSFSAK